MLNSYKIKDSIESIEYNDIKEDCIVCNTHLVSIVEVSGANLFEKKESEAISYISALAHIINEAWIPVQLITQSRPKDFSNHIRKIKETLKDNDYNLKFKKDIEWFEMYYDKDLKELNISKEWIKEKFEQAPEYIERSMLNSYLERLNTMVKNNNILEKRYFFVLSTLEQPKWIEESIIEKSYESIYDFSNENIFRDFKEKLDKKTKHIINIIAENSWMATARKGTQELENIMFDYFNFPISKKHKINRFLTEYWKVPPILNNSKIYIEEDNKKEKLLIKQWEKLINSLGNIIAKEEKQKWVRSNEINQLLKPFTVDDSKMEYLKINNSYSFTIHINRFWDEFFEDLMLWPILTMHHIYDLSIHHIPLNREEFLLAIKKKKQRIEDNFNEKKKWKSSSMVALEKDKATEELEKVGRLENDMRNKTSWYFSTSIDITFRANSKKELEEMKTSIQEKLSTKRIFYSEATGNHLDWFITTAPLLKNKIAWYWKIFERYEQSVEELSHYYPYCPDSIISEKGLWIWISKQWSGDEEIKNITFFDYFDRTRILNSNMIIIWQSGSGKTTTAHQLFRTQELLWNRHLIIDFLWNYIKWAQDTPDKFRVIKISPLSINKINPCDIIFPSDDFLRKSESFKWLSIEEIKWVIIDDKVSELSAYFRMFLEDDYNPKTRWILDKATKKTYEKYLKNIDITKTKFYWDILLTDIIKTLSLEKENKQVIKDIIAMLDTFATWSMAWMFNSKTNIKLDNKSIVFYLRESREWKYRELAVLQSFILIKRIAYSSKNNILAIDELHEIFRIKSEEVQNFFRSQIATIRNLDWWILWMTQFLEQIIDIKWWKEFFNLSTIRLYLAWWLSNSDDDNNIINYEKVLSNSSKNYLLNNNRPWYGILLLWQEQIQLKIDTHPDVSMHQRYKPPKW